MLAGSLFATAINMRSASTALGGEAGVTLVDKLHVVTLLTILLAATMCVVSRILFDSKAKPALVKKLNYTAFTLAVLTFVLANIILIGLAAA